MVADALFTADSSQATELLRYRHRRSIVDGEEVTEKYEKRIKRPQIIEDFYEFFSAVDVHDHLRQGSLRMEEAWKTKTWAHRIFSTVLGIILTDCYLAYRMTKKAHNGNVVPTFSIFLGTLAEQMIHNDGLQSSAVTRSDTEQRELVIEHRQGQLIDHPFYEDLKSTGKRARVRCKVLTCGFKTGTYCICCSSDMKQVECVDEVDRVVGVYGVCSTGTGRDCYAKHIAETK